MSDTPLTDALRASDYILTRNDCLIGMEKYREHARSLERSLASKEREIERLRGALNAMNEWARTGAWEAPHDLLDQVSAALQQGGQP